MRLNSNYLTHTIDNASFLVPVGEKPFQGLARGNSSASFLLELLKEDVTEEALVEAMCKKYDAPRETIAADVREFLGTLRGVGAIAE